MAPTSFDSECYLDCPIRRRPSAFARNRKKWRQQEAQPSPARSAWLSELSYNFFCRCGSERYEHDQRLTQLELLNEFPSRVGIDVNVSRDRAQVSVTGEHLNVSDPPIAAKNAQDALRKTAAGRHLRRHSIFDFPFLPSGLDAKMAPKYHPTPLSGGHRKALNKELRVTIKSSESLSPR